MLAILKEYLCTAAGPELFANIDEAHGLFDDFELPDFTLEFEELLAVSDDLEAGSLVGEIYNLTHVFQEQILRQHLITISHDCTLVQANSILRTIKQIEVTEFTQEVLSICENENDPTDAFVEIMAIVSGIPSALVATYIDRVEISLIKKIIQLVTQRINNETLNVIDHNTLNAVIERYKDFCNGLHMAAEPLVSTYIEQGVSVGETFDVYCKFIKENITTKDPKEIASEYIAAALVSSNVPKYPKDAIQKELNTIYSDIDVITPILMSVDKQLLDMEIRLNSGIKKVQ